MNRRRSRGSGSRKVPADLKTASDLPGEPSSSDCNFILVAIFVLFFVVFPAGSAILYHVKYSSEKKLVEKYVDGNNLLKTDLNYEEIINGNSKVSKKASHRFYHYPVLVYLTPWNSRGYDIATKFINKFTHVAPVWYNLKSQGTNLMLEGSNNADVGWMAELRRKGDALVLPRVVLEAFPMKLLRNRKLKGKAIDLMVSECREMEYDGIVLESWSRWAAYDILGDPDMRNKAVQFVEQLGEALHSMNSSRKDGERPQLIFVISPPHQEKLLPIDFGPKDLQRLHNSVDGFSLMTYDFSGPQNPGPNAPLKWIQHAMHQLIGTTNHSAQILAKKIFLGVNFYGYDFILSQGVGGRAITGGDYVPLLVAHRPKIQWENNWGEHFFVYSDKDDTKHAVFYPSLQSLSLRLQEAKTWGAGLSIWEIGQGLDYFFDLL